MEFSSYFYINPLYNSSWGLSHYLRYDILRLPMLLYALSVVRGCPTICIIVSSDSPVLLHTLSIVGTPPNSLGWGLCHCLHQDILRLPRAFFWPICFLIKLPQFRGPITTRGSRLSTDQLDLCWKKLPPQFGTVCVWVFPPNFSPYTTYVGWVT